MSPRDSSRQRTDEENAPLRCALWFLESDLAPETVVRAGYLAGVLVGLGAGAATVRFFGILPGVLVGTTAGLLVSTTVEYVPRWLARVRRTRSLGDATALVGLLVLRVRLDPSLERAVRFAIRTDEGRLFRALDAHVRRARGGPESGLAAFAADWRPYFPALDRAAAQLASATTVPAGRRERALDRAMDAVVDGTREEMAAYASGIRSPVTGIYAFGVLLPLALVGVLPAAPAAGVPVSLPAVALAYLVVLPIGLLAAGAWLLARRPVAFPPPPVTSAHPDASGTVPRTIAVAGGCAAAAWLCAGLVAPDWTRAITAVGVGAGGGLLSWFRPVEAVRRRVREVEEGLPDALVRIGQRVAEGDAVETALERAAADATGPTGDVLEDAVAYGQTFRVDVRTAFLARDGALATVPSPRFRRAAGLLGVAARIGRPAGDVILDLATHLEELDRIETEARGRLSDVTGTLSNTATVFGPLVGGATVALSDRIRAVDAAAGGSGSFAGTGTVGGGSKQEGTAATEAAFATGDLGLVIGAYVLVLAALLTALATGIERGLDPASIGYRVGRALPIASAVYVGSFLAAAAVL
ncbi:type II secretion system transmembrane protein [Halalkaliarchaeum desulfuricum]|uniref:Type II secretion system transmembrane protein n=1 Tax=Halalkaliarchaeum desulfuricum TaxID=2055893 RepID=A0A343TJ90_9EURY|nr:type II secretion system protein [Halalkaliarchaeum desulfuricum]AUX09162.1 type II secretion system transmembrane protein [Halalkaliarchaeum desulfuricum]